MTPTPKAGDENETRYEIYAGTPDGDEYLIVVAMRGTDLLPWFFESNPLGLVFELVLQKIRPIIGRRSPVGKVGVFEYGRFGVRREYKAWVPGPEDADALAAELRDEIQRGHFRWESP